MLVTPCPLHTENWPPYATEISAQCDYIIPSETFLVQWEMLLPLHCLSERCVMECNSVTALFFAALSSAGRRGLAPLAGPLISCEKMETMMGRDTGA